MPDTTELQKHFGEPSAQAPGCGFPVAKILALFHADRGLLIEVLAVPLRTHEMSRAGSVHSALKPNCVLVGDRGFCSFAQLAVLRQGMEVERVSFVDALRWLVAAEPVDELPRLVVNPERPGRVEPRVRKKRPKQSPLMKKQQRSEWRNHMMNQGVSA